MNRDKFAPQAISIWARNNKWGYKFNVNHPTVNKLYKEYQKQHGLDTRIAMTDAQRHAFERELLPKLREAGLT